MSLGQKFLVGSRALTALTLAFGFSFLSLANLPAQANSCAPGFEATDTGCTRTYTPADTDRNFVVPIGVGSIDVEMYGGAGGLGGRDCGSGCTMHVPSQVGHAHFTLPVVAGKSIGIWPGGAGGNGRDGVNSAGGGGTAGQSSYVAGQNSNLYDGGSGGSTGPLGTSGAGGGGGAATVLTIDANVLVVAGGGGGGGAANSPGSGGDGSSIANPAKSTNGADGTSPNCIYGAWACDGGGGGGGGGGATGGLGGNIYNVGSEAAGNGGFIGTSSIGNFGEANQVDYLIAPLAGQAKSAQPDGKVIINYDLTLSANSFVFKGASPTNASKLTFVATFNKPLKNVGVSDITVGGTAGADALWQRSITSVVNANNFSYAISIWPTTPDRITDGSVMVLFRGSQSQVITLKRTGPSATIALVPGSLTSAAHVFEVVFDEPVLNVDSSWFKIAERTSATGCAITGVSGSAANYQVSVDGCGNGAFALTLIAGSAEGILGNKGPAKDVTSAIAVQAQPVPVAATTPGVLPQTLTLVPLSQVLSTLPQSTIDALTSAKVVAPTPNVPAVNLSIDLTSLGQNDTLATTATQQIDAGTAVSLGMKVSAAIAAKSDLVAFAQVDGEWQYLGRSPFNSNAVTSAPIGFDQVGNYAIKMVLVDKATSTNFSLGNHFAAGFKTGLPAKHFTAISDAQTNLSNQQVTINLTVVPGANGAPALVTPSATPTADPNAGGIAGLITLPTFTPGEPVANPAIGATGDDNAPSQPFDPLASPASVVAVAKSTTAAVVVVSSVAAAAGAAASAAAGAAGSAGAAGGTPRAGGSQGGAAGAAKTGSSTSGTSSSQDTSQDTSASDGSVATIDAEVESFTTAHERAGDRFVLFNFRAFNFLDRLSHNIVLATARFSPVISKVFNDGAYLRAMLGSFYLILPITGILLGAIPLNGMPFEVLPPQWQWLLAIALLGAFDAFSGFLAAAIFVVGSFIAHGYTGVDDVRLMAGVFLIGFGPALITLGFRSIRRHFETSFGYFWERLTDLAIVAFFSSWTVSSMVSTLPALAGKTLAVANHVADFSTFIAAAITIRVIFEEIAARYFPARLDRINPTEVPGTSLLQRSIATAMRLAIFIFVTAAFMGNSWQVWVGSALFIVPNILGWLADRLPNYAFIWRIMPEGVPGLAFTLLVASATSGLVHDWLGSKPDFAQWSFVLLPIPMLALSILGLFGREGNEGEERPIKRPALRWVYRIGGIVMLGLTMHLAGVA